MAPGALSRIEFNGGTPSRYLYPPCMILLGAGYKQPSQNQDLGISEEEERMVLTGERVWAFTWCQGSELTQSSGDALPTSRGMMEGCSDDLLALQRRPLLARMKGMRPRARSEIT